MLVYRDAGKQGAEAEGCRSIGAQGRRSAGVQVCKDVRVQPCKDVRVQPLTITLALQARLCREAGAAFVRCGGGGGGSVPAGLPR